MITTVLKRKIESVLVEWKKQYIYIIRSHRIDTNKNYTSKIIQYKSIKSKMKEFISLL